MLHLNPVYKEACGQDTCTTTNRKDVDCPACLENMKGDPRKLLVDDHAAAMLRTLQHPKNARKGTWHALTPYELLALAEAEMSELTAAVWAFSNGGPVEHVVNESADLSNFAAMIADNCRRSANDMPKM